MSDDDPIRRADQIGRLASLIPAAVYTCDAEGRITYFNRRAAELWGREPRLGDDQEKFCGSFRLWKPDGTLLRHEDCPMADAVRDGRAARNLEVVIEQPSGRRIVANVNIDPLFDVEGRLVGAINAFMDVTERKQVEARLHEREADLARVQRIAEVGGLDIDVAAGLSSRRSPEYLRLHGLPADTGRETHEQWLERVYPADREHAERTLFAALHGTGATYDSEYRIVRPADGAVRWIHARADIERDDDGIAKRLVGAHFDVTERKRTEEALRESEARLRTMVAELQHHVRNILAVVRSVFQRTVDAGGEIEEMASHFIGRLDALARTQVIVTRNPSGRADLETIVRDELLSVGASDGPHVRIEGPDIALPSKMAESLGLAIHELATNALKYGALRTPGASLDISWNSNLHYGEGRLLTLVWQEQGVPTVPIDPVREGFGRELIEEALPYRLGAETKLEFLGGGIRCSISLPLSD